MPPPALPAVAQTCATCSQIPISSQAPPVAPPNASPGNLNPPQNPPPQNPPQNPPPQQSPPPNPPPQHNPNVLVSSKVEEVKTEVQTRFVVPTPVETGSVSTSSSNFTASQEMKGPIATPGQSSQQSYSEKIGVAEWMGMVFLGLLGLAFLL